MIKFKKIRYKNFLSTGNIPIEVELDKSSTTLIVGSNGSGKSTLLDALCYALFNKPFRIIKKDQMVNTINNSDTLVEVEFEVGTNQYMIRRGIKPNLFEIYQNNKLINQDASSIDYQKYLEQNIMKLNYRSFIQVVILGSSLYEPFMKMKSRYRKEAVEEILDIKVFSHMDWMLRDQQGQLSKEILDVRHKCDLIETKYETELKHFNALSDLNTNDIDDKKEQLEKNNKANETYTLKVEELNKEIDSIKENDSVFSRILNSFLGGGKSTYQPYLSAAKSNPKSNSSQNYPFSDKLLEKAEEILIEAGVSYEDLVKNPPN